MKSYLIMKGGLTEEIIDFLEFPRVFYNTTPFGTMIVRTIFHQEGIIETEDLMNIVRVKWFDFGNYIVAPDQIDWFSIMEMEEDQSIKKEDVEFLRRALDVGWNDIIFHIEDYHKDELQKLNFLEN